MNHISIEGMDGVGKTTTCELLSKSINYEFVEKPLHYLFDKNDNSFEEYIRIRDKVNANSNRLFTSWFYGLGSIYMYDKYKDANIITDRHLASNYAWSGNDENKEVYELLVNKLGIPKLTVILYATSEEIINRLKKRSKYDGDIKKANDSELIYRKMIQFCDTYSFRYILLDSTNLSPAEVVNEILGVLNND